AQANGPSTTESPLPSHAISIQASTASLGAHGTSSAQTNALPEPERASITPKSIRKGANLGLEVLYEPPDGLVPAVDIIFVHGLTGNSYGTWCSDEVHWPSDLLKVDIPDARILSFGYDADVVGWWSPTSNNRIGNHAENLLGRVTRLREKTTSEGRSLIFVMHSLGGLLVQNALDLSRSSPEPHLMKLESSTIGLVFMGTPHFGADKAKWGSFCATMLGMVKKTNKSIVQILNPESEMLASIQKRFHEVLRLRQAKGQPLNITCFYEEMPLPVFGTVVDMKSAILQGYSAYGIHATHTGMTKFKDVLDKGYEDVSGELLRWVKDARETVTATPELQEECLHCLYFDGLDSRQEVIGNPLEGTFSWIWDKNQCGFIDWLKDGRGLYWICGRASSGKSTLMKHIVKTSLKNTKDDRPMGQDPVIVSHFIGGQHPVASTVGGIARALLWQVLKQDISFLDFFLPHFQEMKQSQPTLDWKPSTLHEILVKILSQKRRRCLWVFLDGLDEYPGDLLEIADICNNLAQVASRNVRICVSSRPEQVLVYSLGLAFNTSDNVMKLEAHTPRDIKIFATKEINRLSGP
ncbi:hypothetical protein CEP53_015375, partial [Fusarium sp. AF-6]